MAGPANILLADDDEELAELLRDYLSRNGFNVKVAPDGQAALEYLNRSDDYDALVLDVMLPKTSGLDVLRELRRKSQMPVLMLTALGEDIDRILGLELGADDYVPKPCNPREISARLRSLVRRSHAETDSPRLPDLQLGGVHLIAAARLVTVRDRPVTLTSTEFNILTLLMQNAGRPVGKNVLAQSVLGRKLSSSDRSVDVHISKLRRKLGPAVDGGSLIHTIKRSGYLFRVTS